MTRIQRHGFSKADSKLTKVMGSVLADEERSAQAADDEGTI